MIDDPDELVSAYLDGQVTAEEAARVESDPELLALADEMRAVTGSLAGRPVPPIDPATMARHLGEALAAFDQAGADGPGQQHLTIVEPADEPGHHGLVGLPPPGAPVPESAAIRAARARSGASTEAGSAEPADDGRPVTALDDVRQARAGARPGGGVPPWMRVAAAVVVMGGGIAFATTRMNSRTGDTAGSNAVVAGGAQSTTGTTAAAGSRLAESAKGAAAPGNAPSFAADSGDTAASTTASPRVAGGAVSAPAPTATPTTFLASATTGPPFSTLPGSTTTRPGSSTTAATTVTSGSGVLSYAAVPSDATLSNDVSKTSWREPALASCGAVVTPPAGTVLVGWVPASVGGVAGQALVYRPTGSSVTTVLLRQTATCQSF